MSEETIKKFGLGFANKTSNDLTLYLRQKGYSDEQIIQAGLATADERYGGVRQARPHLRRGYGAAGGVRRRVEDHYVPQEYRRLQLEAIGGGG